MELMTQSSLRTVREASLSCIGWPGKAILRNTERIVDQADKGMF